NSCQLSAVGYQLNVFRHRSVKASMRNTLLALSVVLSSGCVVIDAAVDRETEHINQTAALAPGGTLRLKNFSGRVTITCTDRQEATVRPPRDCKPQARH